MAQGLRPHRHVCFVSDIQPYYDKKKHQKMKKSLLSAIYLTVTIVIQSVKSIDHHQKKRT